MASTFAKSLQPKIAKMIELLALFKEDGERIEASL